MSVLTINAGSSSLRLSLFASSGSGGLVRLAEVHHSNLGDSSQSLLTDFFASLDDVEITLLVHRVVHGGAHLSTPCLIDAAVEKEIERLNPLAPLHNPPALKWVRLARRLLGKQVPQVAVFDTAFYQSMPPVASTYALPREMCQRYGIRRYGFHGIAHRAMWLAWQKTKPASVDGGRVISIQLGSGCSITAIAQGQAVDSSMGFSPLEGLVMATRSGDLDPGIITFLQREVGLAAEEIDDLLSKKSGLLGLSGLSGDMRDLLASDQPEAQLAVAVYCYRVRKYIGAYLAVLGGVDAILFGGGVGENSPQVRAKIIKDMAWLGLALDASHNENTKGKQARISTTNSQSEIWVIPVDEASVMAQEAVAVFF